MRTFRKKKSKSKSAGDDVVANKLLKMQVTKVGHIMKAVLRQFQVRTSPPF